MLHETLIRPILTYGSECWLLSKIKMEMRSEYFKEEC